MSPELATALFAPRSCACEHETRGDFHVSRNLVRRIGRVVVPMHMRRAAMSVA
jgi:hypothetical protein